MQHAITEADNVYVLDVLKVVIQKLSQSPVMSIVNNVHVSNEDWCI